MEIIRKTASQASVYCDAHLTLLTSKSRGDFKGEALGWNYRSLSSICIWSAP
jgi:hypothetical protein